MNTIRTVTALAGTAVLAVPALASADKGATSHHGAPAHAAKPAHVKKAKAAPRSYVLKGTIAAVDATAGALSVAVIGGSHHAKGYKGKTVSVAISAAKIVARDANADGTPNLAADLRSGDKVVVKVRLAKGEAVTQPLPARTVVDQGMPAVSTAR